MIQDMMKKLGLRRGKNEESRVMETLDKILADNKRLSGDNLRLRLDEVQYRNKEHGVEDRINLMLSTLNMVAKAFGLPEFDSKVIPEESQIRKLLSHILDVAHKEQLGQVVPELFNKLGAFDEPVSIVITRDSIGEYQTRVVKLDVTHIRSSNTLEAPPWFRRPDDGKKEEKIVVLRSGKRCKSVSESVISACTVSKQL